MTESRLHRNVNIKREYIDMRMQDMRPDDVMKQLAEKYFIEPSTVKQIVFNKNYLHGTRKKKAT